MSTETKMSWAELHGEDHNTGQYNHHEPMERCFVCGAEHPEDKMTECELCGKLVCWGCTHPNYESSGLDVCDSCAGDDEATMIRSLCRKIRKLLGAA